MLIVIVFYGCLFLFIVIVVYAEVQGKFLIGRPLGVVCRCLLYVVVCRLLVCWLLVGIVVVVVDDVVVDDVVVDVVVDVVIAFLVAAAVVVSVGFLVHGCCSCFSCC